LGSWLSAFILSFTVVTVLAAGIIAAYGVVLGILYALAPRPQPEPRPATLMANRAHAGGD